MNDNKIGPLVDVCPEEGRGVRITWPQYDPGVPPQEDVILYGTTLEWRSKVMHLEDTVANLRFNAQADGMALLEAKSEVVRLQREMENQSAIQARFTERKLSELRVAHAEETRRLETARDIAFLEQRNARLEAEDRERIAEGDARFARQERDRMRQEMQVLTAKVKAYDSLVTGIVGKDAESQPYTEILERVLAEHLEQQRQIVALNEHIEGLQAELAEERGKGQVHEVFVKYVGP